MTKEDKKEITEIFNESIQTAILPALNILAEKVEVLQIDMKEVKESLSDVKHTVDKIERTQRAEIARARSHEARIKKLELQVI